jgi:hypothetical protein
MQLLLPGEDIKFSDPADVGGSYEAFQYRTLLACCAAMGEALRLLAELDHSFQIICGTAVPIMGSATLSPS